MPAPYPPIEPYASGRLDVGDGQRVYWETCGSPGGKPALVVHGGPGSGCTPELRRLFDPARHRIVLFDQRGAGRSAPHTGDASTSLAENTTWHLIDDVERLRGHLGVERWLVHGRSWGSTLALAYAQRHPERVSELVLGPVTMTRRSDVAWFTRGVSRFFPEAWDAFRRAVDAEPHDGDLAAAYARRLEHADPSARDRAARAWCDWEEAVVSLETGEHPNPRYRDARFRLGFARTVTHYFRHGAWLEEGQLLRDAHRLARIPGVLIHGRLDLSAPLGSAWELSRAWPGSELVVLERSGHASEDLDDRVVAATDRLAAGSAP